MWRCEPRDTGADGRPDDRALDGDSRPRVLRSKRACVRQPPGADGLTHAVGRAFRLGVAANRLATSSAQASSKPVPMPAPPSAPMPMPAPLSTPAEEGPASLEDGCVAPLPPVTAAISSAHARSRPEPIRGILVGGNDEGVRDKARGGERGGSSGGSSGGEGGGDRVGDANGGHDGFAGATGSCLHHLRTESRSATPQGEGSPDDRSEGGSSTSAAETCSSAPGGEGGGEVGDVGLPRSSAGGGNTPDRLICRSSQSRCVSFGLSGSRVGRAPTPRSSTNRSDEEPAPEDKRRRGSTWGALEVAA